MQPQETPATPQQNTKPEWDFVRITVSSSCAYCGQNMMVNGLFDELYCGHCKQLNKTDRGDWISVLKDISGRLKKQTMQQEQSSYVRTLAANFDRRPVTCVYCNAQVEFSPEAEMEAGKMLCENCKSEISYRRVDKKLRSQVSALQWVIGEERQLSPDEQIAELNLVQRCPSCGASLEVDGKKKLVECKFCLSSVTLSDELWQRLHPIAGARPWYVIFNKQENKTERELAYEKAMSKRYNQTRRPIPVDTVRQPVETEQQRRAKESFPILKVLRMWLFDRFAFILVFFYACLAFVMIGRYSQSGLTLWKYLETPTAQEELPPKVGFGALVVVPIILTLVFLNFRRKLKNGWRPEDDKDDSDNSSDD